MALNPTDFHRMWIVVPPSLQEKLADDRVLTCSHEVVQFALATEDNLGAALDRRTELAADTRPAFVLPVTQAVLAAIAAGESVEIRVLTGNKAVAGSLRLTGERNNALRTVHGRLDVDSITLDELKAGDFFAISERDPMLQEWVVYRALEDAAGGTVQAERTYRDQHAPVTFFGEDQVVFRIADRAYVLARLRWDDLPVAA